MYPYHIDLSPLISLLTFTFISFIYLTGPGLNCSRQDLYLQSVGSSFPDKGSKPRLPALGFLRVLTTEPPGKSQ